MNVQTVIEPQAISPVFSNPVIVLFTSLMPTLKALQKAHQLAASLKTDIEVLAVQIVPRLLPLDDPPIQFEIIAHRIEEAAAQLPEKTKISTYLCRDLTETLQRILRRNSLVVMGIKQSWWPNRDQRLARKLCHAGYDVILVETK
ncbi:MAG TPA: hypothetical protein VMG30_04455 [Acidobacteriota bacterium]|nr:hypothetical protein [Acidobacteriota bacterium]